MSHTQAHFFDLDGCLLNDEFRNKYGLLLTDTLRQREPLLLEYICNHLTPAELEHISEPDQALMNKIVTLTNEFKSEFYQNFRQAVQFLLRSTNKELLSRIQAGQGSDALIVASVSNRQDLSIDHQNACRIESNIPLPSVTEALLDMRVLLGAQLQPLLSDLLYSDRQVGDIFEDIQQRNEQAMASLTQQERVWEALRTYKEQPKQRTLLSIAEELAIQDTKKSSTSFLSHWMSINEFYKPAVDMIKFPISDASKVAIYFQNIQLAMNASLQSGMTPPLHVYLYDDLPGLLENASIFFKENPQLLPAGTVVHFVQHTGNHPTLSHPTREFEVVEGSGPTLEEPQVKACMQHYKAIISDAPKVTNIECLSLLHAVAQSQAIPKLVVTTPLPQKPVAAPLLLKPLGTGKGLLAKRAAKAAPQDAQPTASSTPPKPNPFS